MKVIFFKCYNSTSIASSVEHQFLKGKEFIYNKVEENILTLFEKENESLYCIIYIVDKDVIEKLWLGKCRQYKDSKLIIENAYKLDVSYKDDISTLYNTHSYTKINDKNDDYLSYINIADDKFLSIVSRINKQYQETYQNSINISFDVVKSSKPDDYLNKVENHLRKLAQRSEYAIRAYPIKPDSYRTEFQRDRDRIVYSKAFRRLVDKAQIFTSAKGSHYRTRLTHSLELAQISRDVARRLKVNEDLTEAIALGHDLGHTPFGHEGERELDNILNGSSVLKNKNPLNYGGFKHNYQSLRIVTLLEEKYYEHPGLNLTYQTMEGILKHTRIKRCKKCNNCVNGCYNIHQFFHYGNIEYLYLDLPEPTTIEGQIVKIADEIAQRSHDLDDGIASGIINISEFKEELNDPEMKLLNDFLDLHIENKYSREITNKDDLLKARIASNVLTFFITDLINNSESIIKQYETNFDGDKIIIKDKLVDLSLEAKTILEKLENIITSKVINSQEVNCFDGKSAYIIRKLFKAYYTNPRQLPDNTLKRIELAIKSISPHYVDIRTGRRERVNEEIQIYQGSNSFEYHEQKHRIFMRNIADLISGMTDTYAKEQFKNLYLP